MQAAEKKPEKKEAAKEDKPKAAKKEAAKKEKTPQPAAKVGPDLECALGHLQGVCCDICLSLPCPSDISDVRVLCKPACFRPHAADL